MSGREMETFSFSAYLGEARVGGRHVCVIHREASREVSADKWGIVW